MLLVTKFDALTDWLEEHEVGHGDPEYERLLQELEDEVRGHNIAWCDLQDENEQLRKEVERNDRSI